MFCVKLHSEIIFSGAEWESEDYMDSQVNTYDWQYMEICDECL